MRNILYVAAFAVILTLISGAASAGVPTVDANDVFHVEPGDTFDVVIFVECHAEVANYTVIVTLHPRFQFVPEGSDMNVTGDGASITYVGYDTDILRYEFSMVAENDTPEGDYKTAYAAFWIGSETGFNSSQVTSGSITISVGEGTDGSCSTLSFTIFPALAVISSFTIVKRYKR
jgi:hypothetical protein